MSIGSLVPDLSWAPLEGIGLGAIVATLLFMLFTGRIVVKYVYDAAIKQSDKWERAYRETERQNGVLVDAINKSLGGKELSVEVLQALRAKADEGRGS